MDWSSGIGELKGIGAKTEQLFHNLGVYTVGDILLHYPRDYEKLPPVVRIADLPGLFGGEERQAEEAGREEIEWQAGEGGRNGKGLLPEAAGNGGEGRQAGITAAVALRVSQSPFVRAGRTM